MGDGPTIEHLVDALRDLVGWWRAEDVQGIVIGGVAASLLGKPRMTRDVDALVSLEEARWASFLESGHGRGFVPRAPDCLEFARASRVLLIRHDPSGVDLEVVLAGLLFEEEAILRGVWTDVAGVPVPLASAEDLIVMKAVAHRPRDLADVEGIVASQADLDWNRVLNWARRFGDALARSDIYRFLETLRQQQGAAEP